MGKRLHTGRYTFDSTNSEITLKGNINPERLLLITNVTDNVIIYNFAEAGKGFTGKFYSVTDNNTIIQLEFDCSSMSNSDSLQIFIEEEDGSFMPAESLLDPVGKLRVSNPGNLIDTDFEYGLQASKWETLQTVSNIPTIYSTSGDLPIEGVSSVTAVNGSKSVKVTTTLPHGLSIGDPIAVQGLTLYQAEGFFIISSVSSTTEFFFSMDVESNVTGEIQGSYTTIIPAKFFEGSTVPVSSVDGAQTDAATPSSSIDVTTTEAHGFAVGTKTYLRNTVGPKTFTVSDPSITAEDGRPTVDTQETFENNFAITSSTDTGRGTYKTSPVIGYDWESTHTTYLTPSDINTTSDTINWASHNLSGSYAVLFNTPRREDTDGGMTDGSVYFVEVVDVDTIKLHNNEALSSLVNLTTLNNTYGLARLGLAYVIERSVGTNKRTTYYQASQASTSATTSTIDGSSTANTNVFTEINLTTLLGFNPTTANIDSMTLAGDVNSSNENIDFFIVNQSGTILQSIFNIYSPGNQSSTLRASTFPSTDITSFLYTSGGSTFVRIRHDCETSVNNFIFGSGNPLYKLQFTISGTSTNTNAAGSGKDLASATYGLGGELPGRIVAFQGFTSNSYTNTSDVFSSITSQKNNGRYGTANILTTNTITGTGNDGSFDLDISTTDWNIGTSSQIVYIFARLLSADRNTIYSANHGINDTGGLTGTLVIPTADYSGGARFKFHDGNNNAVQIDREDIPVNINVTSPDTVRVQPTVSPNTDDIASFPDEFTLVYNEANLTFNTVYLKNHKINSDTAAIYTTGSGAGATIAPLTSSDSITLQRVNDNRVRLQLGSSRTTTTGAVTNIIGNASNAVTSSFIDLETIVGYVPTVASITQVEFRGDFSGTNEYVTITFDDSTSFDIGRTGGQDTGTFLVDQNWSTKDISSILSTSGGQTGFNVQSDPTPAVNFSPIAGTTDWWQLRFTLNTESDTIVLNASSTGSGEQIFSVSNLVGAYDGIFEITSVPSNKDFIIESDFTIPTREYDFTSSDFSVGTGVITFSDSHNFISGEKVTYDSGSNTSILPAGILETYAIAIDSGSIRLAGSEADALQNVGLTLTSPTGTHSLKSNNVIKALPGAGTISTTNGDLNITGTGTNFLTDFKRFDKIYIETSTFVKAFTVDTITTEGNMTIFEDPGETLSGTSYFFATQITLKPDGFAKHLPFDGGVDITAGSSPNSKIMRQTRKYFRYQSGKGIQNSFAINFNPPRLVKDLITSTGTTAIVNTQEAHNLTIGDEIRIEGATVTTGINEYNGTFTVASVPGPFRFTYTMGATPDDNRAGGFPTYTRTSWTDAFVRAGMFDDQNGFFYEYDGQKLYAVRRSSTAQISGTVSATRGNQVITGVGTSFTSQLTQFGNIVIRGQSYEIVQIKSDTEAVIQPAYKGVTANNIRATITVDTRVPQDSWNIDKCDGNGLHGFVLDLNKIQMGYVDYSWYGAGKIRFGFKDQFGHVIYVHEFIHNNILQESYFRSGNLPGRYEIANGPNPTHSPTLFHFGTSVIMDGRFDDDKAYQFAAFSKPFAFTNGGSTTVTSTGDSTFEVITLNGRRVYVYAIPVSAANAGNTVVGLTISDSNNYLTNGTYVSQVRVDGVNSKIFTSYPATTSDPTGGSYTTIASGDTITLGETTAIDLTRPLPLVSIRLAPSVDNGLTGPVGEREIINRMQLALKSAGVTANQDIEAFIILNALPSEINFEDAQKPSLSELLRHSAGDTLLDGTTIYSVKVSDGSVDIDLSALLEIGNSILGGDSIFPAGPDLLTLAVQPQDTSTITTSTPFFVSGKVSWSESQA